MTTSSGLSSKGLQGVYHLVQGYSECVQENNQPTLRCFWMESLSGNRRLWPSRFKDGGSQKGRTFLCHLW